MTHKLGRKVFLWLHKPADIKESVQANLSRSLVRRTKTGLSDRLGRSLRNSVGDSLLSSLRGSLEEELNDEI
jgi:hypothetical protein